MTQLDGIWREAWQAYLAQRAPSYRGTAGAGQDLQLTIADFIANRVVTEGRPSIDGPMYAPS